MSTTKNDNVDGLFIIRIDKYLFSSFLISNMNP